MSLLADRVLLGSLQPGVKAIVLRVQEDPQYQGIVQRLLELGFLEGSEVSVIHVAPWSSDPIAVWVRGSLIALRRQEANLIEVQMI